MRDLNGNPIVPHGMREILEGRATPSTVEKWLETWTAEDLRDAAANLRLEGRTGLTKPELLRLLSGLKLVGGEVTSRVEEVSLLPSAPAKTPHPLEKKLSREEEMITKLREISRLATEIADSIEPPLSPRQSLLFDF